MEFTTLYHPHFEPSETWLRSMLLFYDTIHTIVPKDANYKPSKAISQILDKDEKAVKNISPVRNDLQYEWSQYKALFNVLNEMSNEKERFLSQRAKFEYRDQVPILDIPGVVNVHYDKMADLLRMDLLDLGLAVESNEEKWLLVDKRVADLILAMLASNIIKNRHELTTISSDQEDCFAVARGCEKDDVRANANAILASSILSTQIPENISELSIQSYFEIRKAFQEKRQSFHLAIKDLNDLYFKRSFAEPQDFQKLLKEVVVDFDTDIKKIKKSETGKRIRKWGTIILGSVVSISAAVMGNPTVSFGAATITAGLQIIQGSQGDSLPGNNITRAQSVLVNIKKELKWNTSRLGRILSH